MLLRRAAMLLDAEEHWRLPDEDYRVLYPSWKIKDDKEKKRLNWSRFYLLHYFKPDSSMRYSNVGA